MEYKEGGYECHMTFDKEQAKVIEDLPNNIATGFVYSVITGCPLLGQGTYCYLTSYSKADPNNLVYTMKEITRYLEAKGIPTLRAKVEHIVFDSKTSVNELAPRAGSQPNSWAENGQSGV